MRNHSRDLADESRTKSISTPAIFKKNRLGPSAIKGSLGRLLFGPSICNCPFSSVMNIWWPGSNSYTPTYWRNTDSSTLTSWCSVHFRHRVVSNTDDRSGQESDSRRRKRNDRAARNGTAPWCCHHNPIGHLSFAGLIRNPGPNKSWSRLWCCQPRCTGPACLYQSQGSHWPDFSNRRVPCHLVWVNWPMDNWLISANKVIQAIFFILGCVVLVSHGPDIRGIWLCGRRSKSRLERNRNIGFATQIRI